MSFNRDKTESENRTRSVLDNYSNRVFRLVVLIVPIFFLCGNAAMTIMYYMGLYPAINGIAMWCSNAIDICFMLIAVYLVKTSYDSSGILIPRNLPIAKMILMVMVVMQWNLNSYICPFTDFWAYAPLFVIVQAFFFDLKLVRLSTALIVGSMILSWLINGEHLLPTHDEFFSLNMMFRTICLTFTLLSINIVTWFGKVFIIEVVAIREKEREIREKSDEYEREARMKSDFLANMSHEIRTPMNAVIGMAEIAMREDLPPNAMDCLTQIQKSGRNLLNIINDILDYSKIEAGKMEILHERYEPSSEMNDISNILATRIKDKDLELFFFADPSIPHALLGDSMRIRQILINLANNAIKFTPEGRVGVEISCESIDEDTVSLTYHIKDTGIGIKEEDMDKLFASFQQVDSRRNRSVEGTGLGLAISQRLVEAMGGSIGVNSVYGKGSDFWFTIPQKVVDATIDMAVRDADKKRAILMGEEYYTVQVFWDEMETLGIQGDYIKDMSEYRLPAPGIQDYLFFDYRNYDDSVRDFLDRYTSVKGIVIIDYNSNFKPDQENLFSLRRPISTPRVVNVLNDDAEDSRLYEEEAYVINFTAPDARILIVDDNAINITIAEGLLAPMDVQIDAALSGPEAIQKIGKEHYDIVLMDHMMPGMDGVDATKIIRETYSEDELVIIALSANALKEARDMFLESGMNDFVAKPIEIKELVAKLRKWLPQDKIIKGTVRMDTSAEDEDPLAGLEMLDTEKAVSALGSPQLLRMIAEEYYKAGVENYDSILNAYKNDKIKDYTIRVHALKSSSRQIGAFELGDRAEALELAGKKNDIDFIKANTDELLAMFRNLLDGLALAFPESEEEAEELPALPADRQKELVEQLKAACEELDMDRMEEIRDELRGYAWPEDVQDGFKSLCEAIDGMEIMTCEEILESL